MKVICGTQHCGTYSPGITPTTDMKERKEKNLVDNNARAMKNELTNQSMIVAMWIQFS